jgi:hypothetical protein
VDGHRHEVVSTDGTRIGLLTAGTGPSLLLMHGGMGCIESWQPLWNSLTSRWRVTAMDRRGRGSSGDTGPYQLSREFEDVTAAVASLAAAGPSGRSAGLAGTRHHPGRRREVRGRDDELPDGDHRVDRRGDRRSQKRSARLRHLPIVSATMPREARALAEVDLNALASDVTVPVC